MQQKKRLEMERYGIERRMKKALDEMDTSQIAPLTEELTALKEKLSELAVQAAAEDAKTAAVVVPPSEETPEEEGEIPPAATVRGLEVIFEFLSRQKFSPIPPGLGHLIEKMVIPEIAVEDKCIRLAAVKCFIVLCPRSMDIAFKFLGVMFEIVRLDSDPVVAEKALIALFNALLRWGPALVNKQDLICSVVSASRLDSSNNTSLAGLPGKERIERKLTSLLDREEEELRIITADGLGKMMLDPRWRCSTVISDLFLANHVYHDSSSKVRQSIITFFKMYCFFVDDPETLVSAFMRALIILAQEIALLLQLRSLLLFARLYANRKELLTHLTDRTDTAVVLWMTFGRMIGWLCPPRDKFVAVRSLKASTAVVIQMKEWEQNKQFSRDLQRFMKRCEVVLSFAPKDMYPGESSISTENRTSTNNQDSMVAQISGFESEIDNDNETKENDQPAAGNLNSANERLVSVGAMSQFSSITSFDPMVCSTVRKPLLSINSEITESTVRDDDAVSDSVFDSSNHES
ncbi:unnamed protein product [Notodromas monacha]|uniref:Nuclear condensin complex subunit 3 C-terminal domain-containing protein n=1 Tax=Notodromas monacha TaxID=399045 RepID=A0A7R9GG59_9CRUS|nr:unnamed protein product [Notodromas monacha]CAG0921363.1 unnamed protein product [Notodromas monacha]